MILKGDNIYLPKGIDLKQYQRKGFRLRQIKRFNKFHQLKFDYLISSRKPEDWA